MISSSFVWRQYFPLRRAQLFFKTAAGFKLAAPPLPGVKPAIHAGAVLHGISLKPPKYPHILFHARIPHRPIISYL
jgi:hypothetical protein